MVPATGAEPIGAVADVKQLVRRVKADNWRIENEGKTD